MPGEWAQKTDGWIKINEMLNVYHLNFVSASPLELVISAPVNKANYIIVLNLQRPRHFNGNCALEMYFRHSCSCNM